MQVESEKYREQFILRERKMHTLGNKLLFLNCCGGLWFGFVWFFKKKFWFDSC